MKKNSNKSLKRLKADILLYESQGETNKAFNSSKELIKSYPNSTFGYESYIRINTDSYQKLVTEEELKELRNIYDKLYSITSKSKQEKLKLEFNEYVLDCKEAYNLIKIKKDLIEQEFIKKINNEKLSDLNRNIKYIGSYSTRGEKVTSIYDLIKGIVFLACLIFNVIYHNYLLFITVPFGIFGLIIIISFFTSRKNKKDEGNVGERKKELINVLDNDLEDINNILNKTYSRISFLSKQKQDKIMNIPSAFTDDLKDAVLDDESVIANKMVNALNRQKYDEFNDLVATNTNLNASDYYGDELGFSKKYITNLINTENNKNIRNKILKMKKINWLDIVLLLLLSILSVISFIYFINNFDLNHKAFIIALIIGIISTISYNVDKGKHSSLFDTFSDNLIITLFRTTLVYDLIYAAIHNGITFRYGFLMVPMIFLCLLIGFILIASLLKYEHLYNKLMTRKDKLL